MLIESVLRAARILHTAPGYSLPLSHLHAQLVRELGPDAGSYREIYQQLRKRTDSFLVIDGARVLDGCENWPGLVREAYDSALEDAGFGSCVRVSLAAAQEGEPCELMAALRATVAELLSAGAHDETLRSLGEQSARQLTEFNRALVSAGTDRPTTLLPDPQPAG